MKISGLPLGKSILVATNVHCMDFYYTFSVVVVKTKVMDPNSVDSLIRDMAKLSIIPPSWYRPHCKCQACVTYTQHISAGPCPKSCPFCNKE